MNNISLYTLLILLYLGMTKSFSPSEKKAPYLTDQNMANHLFKGHPISVILDEKFHVGFLIKTYYLKFKVIQPFKKPQDIIVRTNADYWGQVEKNVGLSLFRRSNEGEQINTLAALPGFVFVNNRSYGDWKVSDSGQKTWNFFRVYRHLPRQLSWKKWRPSYELYEKGIEAHESGVDFLENDRKFGIQANREDNDNNENDSLAPLKKFVKSLFKLPPWKLEQT